MSDSKRALPRLWSRDADAGQGLAEYALILGLIAVVAIVSLVFLGEVINELMSTIGNTIDTQTLTP